MILNQEKTQLFWVKFFDLKAVLFFIDKLNNSWHEKQIAP